MKLRLHTIAVPAAKKRPAVKSVAGRSWMSTRFRGCHPGYDSVTARIDDDREILHRRLEQLFRSVACGRIEEQRIARLHEVAAVGVQVSHFAGQHVDELDAAVTKVRVRHGVLAQRDQIRLDRDLAPQRMPEQIVEVTGLRPAPLDQH